MKKLLQKMLQVYLSVFVLLSLTSCGGSRVVFVPESDGLVRLADNVKGHVYHYDGTQWVLSKNPVHLPEGWYAGSIDVNQGDSDN